MRCERLLPALLLACAVLAQPAFAEDQVPGSCVVTRPPEPAFEPPAPYNEKLTGQFWLGTSALWTKLADDGIWRGIVSPGGTRNKFFWWREGWKWDTDLRANEVGLVITARRIDGDAPLVQAPRVTNAKLASGWAMLTMLEIPASGCWEITGNYRSDYLSMVVWVPDKPLEKTR